MSNHIVHVKVKPILTRKRTIVSNNIQIVLNPNNSKPLHAVKKPDNQNIIIESNKRQANKSVANSDIKKNNPKKPNKPKVKYTTRDITPDSLSKIRQLKNIGRNKILVMVGNGPTVGQVDLNKIRGMEKIDIMSINKPDPRIWPTTYWSFFDLSQLRRNEDLWNDYSGIIINSTGIKRQKENSLQIKNLGGKGFSRDLTKGLHIGRSSVFASMQIAAWLGYEKIYIFGCDMDPAGLNGQLHFYGVNPDVPPNIRKERFVKEAEFYDYAADILNEEERKKFYFCSAVNPWSFVNKFNKLDHISAIEHITKCYSN